MKNLMIGAAALAFSTTFGAPAVQAQAINQYIGDVILTGYTWGCPREFASANGQLLPIAQHTALFSLVGTTYGGNGVQTFALPDLRGRVPVHLGQGPGLSFLNWGQRAGEEVETLNTSNLPPHSHTMFANDGGNDVVNPAGAAFTTLTGAGQIAFATPADTAMDSDTVGMTGGNQAFEISSPSLGLNYCIALTGIYPSRN